MELFKLTFTGFSFYFIFFYQKFRIDISHVVCYSIRRTKKALSYYFKAACITTLKWTSHEFSLKYIMQCQSVFFFHLNLIGYVCFMGKRPNKVQFNSNLWTMTLDFWWTFFSHFIKWNFTNNHFIIFMNRYFDSSFICRIIEFLTFSIFIW